MSKGNPKVLVVCGRNLWRSPILEAALKQVFAEKDLKIEVESAGISREDIGQSLPDKVLRMLKTCGIDIDMSEHRVRLVYNLDPKKYFLVLCMGEYIKGQLERCEFRNVRIVNEHQGGVSDPSGKGEAALRECVELLLEVATKIASRIEIPELSTT